MNTPAAIIRFKGIELVSKKMVQAPESGTIIPLFHFDISAESRVHQSEKLLGILVNIRIKEPNKDFNLAEISVACAYLVENFEQAIILRNDGLFDVLPEVDALVKSVSISTVRGILFSEFRGTYLSEAIMPIIIITPVEQPRKLVENK
jgi:hypothetical protein